MTIEKKKSRALKEFFPGCSPCSHSLADPKRHAPTTGYFRDSQAPPRHQQKKPDVNRRWLNYIFPSL